MADIALRGMAGAALAVIVLVLLRDARGTWAGRLGAVLAAGGIGYLVCSSSGFNAWPDLPRLPFLLPCLANPVLFWMFARALFDDDYRPGRLDLVALVAVVVVGLARVFGQALLPAWLDWASVVAYQGAILGLIGHVLWRALRGRAADLVETRRRFRAVFVVGIGGYMALIAMLEVVLHRAAPPGWLVTLNPAAIWLLSTLVLLRAVRLRHDDLVGALLLPPAPSDAVAPADRALMQRLSAAMLDERLYLEEGLAIGDLATRLAVPEYRLRRLINQQLGHRNFPAFLNGYRIDDAKAALADPARRREPILTIALGLGFGSIGPFNRAFKAATGMTPSEFRQNAAARSDAA
ncbi:MAG: AraC family transcriptional regulator [Alphaproteobacteria bacterium]